MSVAITIDDYSLSQFATVAAGYGQERFGYVVTPNVDHLIRYHDDGSFRDLYGGAEFILLDSRVLARLVLLTTGKNPHVCPGSDLTHELFHKIIAPEDRILVVGGTATQAQALRRQFGLNDLVHIDPPMGFIRDPAATERCLQQIEAASPFRFCFLAIGSPQQEIIANKLRTRGRARGLALCIGASINFITGEETRAPAWLQRLGMEWLFRLLTNPGRLARRYLVRGPRIFLLLPRMRLELRPPTVTSA